MGHAVLLRNLLLADLFDDSLWSYSHLARVRTVADPGCAGSTLPCALLPGARAAARALGDHGALRCAFCVGFV